MIKNRKFPDRIAITEENLADWPAFQRAFDEGRVRFDGMGRLRYLHGAPVGEMILARVRKDGTPIYKESAEQWFDPDSEAAHKFQWP